MTPAIPLFAPAAANATGHNTGLSNALQRRFSSVEFDVYLALLIAALSGFHLPSQVTILTGIIGNANPLIAILIIDCMLEIKIDRTQLKHAYKVLMVRYGVTAMSTALFYFATRCRWKFAKL